MVMSNTIIRQLELVTHDVLDDKPVKTFTGIVYSQWRDGTITRRADAAGDDVAVGYQMVRKVDHNSYKQHTDFMTFIARHEYNMTYDQARLHRLLPKRPETIDERAARRKAYFEKQHDSRIKVKENSNET
jgi:hypothetical protein